MILAFLPFKLDIRAKPSVFVITENRGISFIAEQDETFHSQTVIFFCRYWQILTIEVDGTIIAVLDDNIEDVVIFFGYNSDTAFSNLLFFTSLDCIFNEIG